MTTKTATTTDVRADASLATILFVAFIGATLLFTAGFANAAVGAFKPEAVERAKRAKTTYMDAVKDWAVKGSGSSFVFDPDDARARVPAMSDDIALAHAKFQLAQYLKRIGRTDEAESIFDECRQLHPDSWNIFRETTGRTDRGLAAGEEFWEKVRSLGTKQYYATIDMVGMPD